MQGWVYRTLGVWLLWAGYVAFHIGVSISRYRLFQYDNMDLAAYSQIMWNLVHGSWQSSVLGVNFLGHHAHLILFSVVPVYALFPSPITLLVLQTLALATPVFFFFHLAEKEIGPGAGIALALAYLFYPALWHTNTFEFHVTVFATFFLSGMLYFFWRRWFVGYMVCGVLALLCQENMPLLVGAFGLYAAAAGRSRRWWVSPVALSVVAAVLGAAMMRHFNQGTIQFEVIYRHLGATLPEVALTIVRDPLRVIRIVLLPEKIYYLFQLFIPLAGLPLGDPVVFVLAGPLLQHLLSSRSAEYTITYHYAAEMIPFLFYAAVGGWRRFLNSRAGACAGVRRCMPLVVAGGAIVSQIAWGPLVGLTHTPDTWRPDIWDIHRERLTRRVPADASVVATFDFLPRLAGRSRLYSFHHVVHGFYTLSSRPYELPAGVEYALLDMADQGGVEAFFIRGQGEKNLIRFLEETQWRVVDAVGSLLLLRSGQKGEALFTFAPHTAVSDRSLAVAIDEQFEFAGFEMIRRVPSQEGEVAEVYFYWLTRQRVRADYWMEITLFDEAGTEVVFFERPLAYRFLPTYVWPEASVCREKVVLPIPRVVAGGPVRVRIRMLDLQPDTGRTPAVGDGFEIILPAARTS